VQVSVGNFAKMALGPIAGSIYFYVVLIDFTSTVCLVAVDVSSELERCVRCHVSMDALALLVVFLSWCDCSPRAA